MAKDAASPLSKKLNSPFIRIYFLVHAFTPSPFATGPRTIVMAGHKFKCGSLINSPPFEGGVPEGGGG